MGITPASPETSDAILASTVQHYAAREMVDNIFNKNALLMYLKANEQTFDGGKYIGVPLMYKKSTDLQVYSGLQAINITKQEPFVEGNYVMKEYVCPIVMSERQDAQNSGPESMIGLWASLMQHAELTIQDGMEGDAFAGNALNALKILGLAQHVAATGTVGGFNKASYAWWQAKTRASSSFNTAGTGDGLSKMRLLYTDCSGGGGDPPNFISGDSVFYTGFEGLLFNQLRYVNTQMANAGFENLMFKQATVTWSLQATANTAYFLNTKYIFLKSHRRYNMVAGAPVSLEPIGQLAKAVLIKWKGELVATRANRQGWLTGCNT